MAKKDPRIDAYIAKSADFAKPILKELRKRVHEGSGGAGRPGRGAREERQGARDVRGLQLQPPQGIRAVDRGAKREEPRAQRLATAIEWLAEGKKRNWKYERC